jgi:hypothetical protein
MATKDNGAPKASIAGLPAVQAGKTFTVGWKASDKWSGIKNFDVLRAQASSGGAMSKFKPWKTKTRAPGVTMTGDAGKSYCFRVRARDTAGNLSKYSSARCTAVPIDDRSLQRSGSWSNKPGASSFAGTVSRSSAKGASLSKNNVKARSIVLLATRCDGCGNASVSWNGKVLKQVSLNSPSGLTLESQRMAIETFGRVKSGNIKIKVTSTGKRVDIDGIALTR